MPAERKKTLDSRDLQSSEPTPQHKSQRGTLQKKCCRKNMRCVRWSPQARCANPVPPWRFRFGMAKYVSARNYFLVQILVEAEGGGQKEGETNTPWPLPIALATPRTNFLGPPAVRCGLGLHRENRDSRIGGDRRTLYGG